MIIDYYRKYYSNMPDCGKLRQGGCSEGGKKHLIEDAGTGYSIDSCRARCQSTRGCGVMVFNSNLGACWLYKTGAQHACTTTEADIKLSLAMYSVKACSGTG